MARPDGVKIVATNRQARRNFEILDTFEAGLVLKGSEVKSLREAKVTISDAYARVIDHEAWVVGLHISPYSHAGGAFADLDPDRDRKLLLKRLEIDRIKARVDQDRLTLVPLALYFKNGRAKMELGLGKGRTGVDKRHHIATRDAEREARREVARARRGQ
jgi:SsrA-binding protein